MKFGRRGKRSSTVLALLACLAFVAAAVWAWELPLGKVLQFFWICLLLVMALVLSAALVVWIFKTVQKIFRRGS